VHQNVDVIRHHAPGQKLLAFVMKMQQRMLDKPGDA